MNEDKPLEAARQAELDSLRILDRLEEQARDDPTRRAAGLCDAPVGLACLLDLGPRRNALIPAAPRC